jgi:3-dehydroquinate dehydratase/shikimate dehydrogenase
MPTLVCVSVMVRTVESAHAHAVQAREHGADLVEYRIDELFNSPDDEPEVLRLVAESPLPCIVTCRPTWEGGHYDGDEDARVSLFERLGAADRPPRYIDVELAAYTRSANLRQKVNLAVEHPKQQRDIATGLILSTHDFSGRPADLTRRTVAMRSESAASVHKIAFRARSLRDNLELFDILTDRTKPTIALGMGEFGLMSRVLAPKFGAFLTFASLREEEVTAPGQPTMGELLQKYRFRAINEKTRVYGIVGWPVGHSLSPLIHNAGFEEVGHDGVYVPLPIAASPSELPESEPARAGPVPRRAGSPGEAAQDDTSRADASYASFKATMLELVHHPRLHFAGCSVTLPHKENLAELAFEEGWHLDTPALLSRSANTLVVERGEDGAFRSAHAANTDVDAATGCLREALGALEGKRIALLGAGGVARAIAFDLVSEGSHVTIFNRTPERAARIAREIGETTFSWAGPDAPKRPGTAAAAPWQDRAGASPDAYINCTPVGMARGPAPDESPLPSEAFARADEGLVMETIYNPIRTRLLSDAQDAGWRTIDGVDMFVGQGARQFELWTGRPAPRELFRRLVRDSLGG